MRGLRETKKGGLDLLRFAHLIRRRYVRGLRETKKGGAERARSALIRGFSSALC